MKDREKIIKEIAKCREQARISTKRAEELEQEVKMMDDAKSLKVLSAVKISPDELEYLLKRREAEIREILSEYRSKGAAVNE